MALQTINVGSGINAGDGEPMRDAWVKAAAMFAEIYPVLFGGLAGSNFPGGAIPNSDLALMAAGTVKANLAGGAAAPSNVTLAALRNAIGAAMPRSYLAGLGTANNGSTSLDIASGACRADSNDADMVLASLLTKSLNSNWAVGSGNGGLDTGTKANSTWYYVWLILRTDTGVVDALFSTSKTSPTMPTSYDKKRLIGMCKTDGSGNVLGFTQFGDYFWWNSPATDVSTTSTTTSADATLGSVPPIAGVHAILRIYAYTSGTGTALWVRSKFMTDAAVSLAVNANLYSPVVGDGVPNEIMLPVNASAQVAHRAAATTTSTTIHTRGFIFRRGRDD